MKRIFFSPMLFITLVSISLFATFVHAATLEVGTGKPYTTIQSAINAAVNGDTVLVYPGTYTENNITFNGKAITVKSANGPGVTTIDGSASWTVVFFVQGEGSGSVLDGFTIKNGNGTYGGGIYCDDFSSTVKNSILWGDTATTSGNEIYLASSPITVTYSDVEGGWTGEGNINADPLFVGNGNYHLKADSPCIDTGTSVEAPSDDIDGDTRPQGAGYDIGSDEYTGAIISGKVTGDVQDGVTVTLSGSLSGSTITDSSGNYNFAGLSNGWERGSGLHSSHKIFF